MSEQKNIFWRDPTTIVWLMLGAFFLANMVIMLLKPLNKAINPDELQHLHIAWQIAHGHIIYRDFWEHHGPVYGLLNGLLIYVTDAEPSLRILLWSRILSAGTTISTMIITWLIARRLSLSPTGAFIAVVALSATIVTQGKGIEMRPDPLQSLFWITGLYCLIRHQAERNVYLPITAGALFTLSILSNAKAGLGPFFVVVFYITGHWLCGLRWTYIWRDMLGMAIGLSFAALPFVIYFWANNALLDFLYYNFLWNLEVVLYWSATDLHFAAKGREVSIGVVNLMLFLKNQTAFLLFSGVGALFWLGSMHKVTEPATKRIYWLFLIATAGTSLGWLLNLYTQYFLMFLPLWAILISVAITSIVKLASTRNSLAGAVIAVVIAVGSIGSMLQYSLEKANFSISPILQTQKRFTNRFVSMTTRDEPVAVIWSLCGGYMFNDHVGYYWAALSDISAIIKAMTGEHPHGQNFINEMQTREVKYVIGNEIWLTDGVSDEAMDYIKKNFDYSYCLWTRKENNSD
jgi:hypothetical protein